jgi:hypothetical protein
VGVKVAAAAVAVAAAVIATTPGAFVSAHQQADGGFAEPGGRSSPDATDVALRVLALRAVGADAGGMLTRLEALQRPSGRIGPLVNSTIWGVLALRAARQPISGPTIRYLLRQQRPSGGWSWYERGAPDSNDTAAAIEALCAAGVTGKPISRGLAYLRKQQRGDGGFGLVPGRASDSQSTAWAIQAFIAAGKQPPDRSFKFLARMRRRDGSYRYSARFAVTPVWVTAQVLPALARKPFPLP